MNIRIKRAPATGKTADYFVMQGDKLIATMHHDRPTCANMRLDNWSVCWVSGRIDWHLTMAEARDNVLRGV